MNFSVFSLSCPQNLSHETHTPSSHPHPQPTLTTQEKNKLTIGPEIKLTVLSFMEPNDCIHKFTRKFLCLSLLPGRKQRSAG